MAKKKQVLTLVEEVVEAAKKQGIVFKRDLLRGKTKMEHVNIETPVRMKESNHPFETALEHTGESIFELRFRDGLKVRFSYYERGKGG